MLLAGAEDGAAVVLGILAFFGTLVTSALVLTSSVTTERRTRALELLRMTSLSPWRIVFGKVVAAGVRSLPLALLGLAVTGLFFPRIVFGTANVELDPFLWVQAPRN